MASKERENFYRNSTLIVDHGKDSLVDLLELHLTKNSLLFKDFINFHQHDIYHLCFKKKFCCQCPGGYKLPHNRVLHPPQLEILLDKNGVPCSYQCSIGPTNFCCCLAKPDVTTNVLDITLARCLLVNFCNDVLSSSLRKSIDTLLKMRNTVYGHAKDGRITDVNYKIYKNEIGLAILEIAKVCKKETEKKKILKDLEERSLDETLCIQYQNAMLEQIAKETRLEEKVDDLTDKMPEIVENAVLKALDCYTKQKLTKGTDEEMKNLNPSDSQMKNQQDNPLPVHTINQGSSNYSRLHLVVVDIFQNILRKIMHSNIAPKDLYLHITKNEKNSSYCSKMPIEENESLKTLTNKTYDNIDFSLLYKWMQLFSILPPPTIGWGIPPNNMDVTISDDVERLQLARNKIVHRRKADVDDIEMKAYFSYFVTITQRIDAYLGKLQDQGFAREVSTVQILCMDPEMELRNYQLLKEIEHIEEKFYKENVHFSYGKTFSSLFQDIKNKVKSSVIPISLFLEDINDDKTPRKLNQLKTEINSGQNNIKFKQAFSGCLIIYIDILDSNLLSTEHELCHQIYNFLCRALQLTGFNMKTENEITVVLIKEEAQQSAQVEPVSGISGVEPTTFQENQSAKEKRMKSINEKEGDVSTITQESDESGKGKERENFFRINVLVVDHIKIALVHMFKHYLRQKKMSFEKFIDEHIADIRYLKRSKILYKDEVDKLIVGDKAISGITVDNLELTLERRLLDNLCPDLFMDDGCQTLQDFLKKNQHDIYHLFKYDQRCCQCNDHYTVPVREQLLKENEYNNMFKSSPCTNCTGEVCSGFTCKNTEYIQLDYRTRCTVFEHFSRIFNAVQKLKNLRDDTYGHIETEEIPDDRYDGYYKAIEANILVLARFCGNENETRLALDDVQTRSLDETLCKQYMISLLEEIKRDIELMEVICENSQKLQKLQESNQKIEKHLQKLREHMENMNLNKDVGATFETQTLQDTNILISTPSSGNQSSVYEISVKNQTNVYSRTQQHQLDRRSLENQNLQTLNNDIPSTSTQPPILGIQILMNQTNNIERNSLERDHRQQVAVVESGGLMRNSEPQNLHSSVNPTDDQAGAMTSCSPESSSNNISIGNDQRGQGYQSSIGTDAEPNSSVNNERAHDREKKRDGVVLHVEEDRVAAEEFIKNMERESPDLDIGIISYDNLLAGTSRLGSAANVFNDYSYLFIFETENFTKSKSEMYISEIALVETLKKSEKQERLIPVAVEKDRTCDHPILAPLIPLKYYNYLEAKNSQQGPDQDFIKCFRDLITNGRQKYPKKIVN